MPKKVSLADAEHPDIGAQLRAAAERLGLNPHQISLRANLPGPSVRKALAGGNITLATLRQLLPVLEIEKLRIGRHEIEVSGAVVNPVVARTALAELEGAEERIEEARALIGRLIEDAEGRERLVKVVSEAADRVRAQQKSGRRGRSADASHD